MTKLLIGLILSITATNHVLADVSSSTNCMLYNGLFKTVQICMDSAISEPNSTGVVKIIDESNVLEFRATLAELKREGWSGGRDCIAWYTNTILVLETADLNKISSLGIPLYLMQADQSCRDVQSIQFIESQSTGTIYNCSFLYEPDYDNSPGEFHELTDRFSTDIVQLMHLYMEFESFGKKNVSLDATNGEYIEIQMGDYCGDKYQKFRLPINPGDAIQSTFSYGRNQATEKWERLHLTCELD